MFQLLHVPLGHGCVLEGVTNSSSTGVDWRHT